jgi:hypothetical protein
MAGGRLVVRGPIAIDTNLFSVLLRYYCLESEGASDPERERRLREGSGSPYPVFLEQFDALWRIFAGANRRMVTQACRSGGVL